MAWISRKPVTGTLLVACCLAAVDPASALRPPRPSPRVTGAASAEGLLVRFGRLLTSLWAGNGAGIDPLGNPRGAASTNPNLVQPFTDNGPVIDPFGGH